MMNGHQTDKTDSGGLLQLVAVCSPVTSRKTVPRYDCTVIIL